MFATIFCCAIPTYAADGTENIDVADMEITGNVYYKGSENTVDVTSQMTIVSAGDYYRINIPIDNSDLVRSAIDITLFDNFTFNSEHEYSIKFNWRPNVALSMSCDVVLFYYDNSGNVLKTQYIVSQSSNNELCTVDVSFKPDVTDLSGGYNCKLCILFIQGGWEGTTTNQAVYISKEIEFIDKDDNSGWFQKILNKINDVWESIKSLPDKIGVYISNIASDIGEKIKDLFIPDEEYFQNKKEELETFCIEHFGAVYQSLDVFIDFLNMLINISPTEPKIIFPAIDIPLFDKTYHLTDEVVYSFAWVNDNTHFLYYFYNFYRSFVTVLLFLTFVNYCRNKYAEVFGGDKE